MLIKTHCTSMKRVSPFKKIIDLVNRRVGISVVEETAHYTLPLDLTELLEKYEVSEQSTQMGLDFLSNASTGEEAREKLFLQDSIVLDYELQSEEFIDDLTALAESTLKVGLEVTCFPYDEANETVGRDGNTCRGLRSTLCR